MVTWEAHEYSSLETSTLVSASEGDLGKVLKKILNST